MPSKTKFSEVITRNDTTENWTSVNPILKKGVIAIEYTTDGKTKIKIGNGASNWNDLPYYGESDSSGLVITDDDTMITYKLGIASGLIYLEEK